MKFKLYAFTVCIFMIFCFSGCSGKSASETFKTAKFEELQNNKEHAIELYEEIIKKYPGSNYAQKSKERVAELKAKN